MIPAAAHCVGVTAGEADTITDTDTDTDIDTDKDAHTDRQINLRMT